LTNAYRADYGENCRAMMSGRSRKWVGRAKKMASLLALMAAQGLDVLMTVDQNLRHQQNLKVLGVAVIVLVATSNRMADLVPLMPSAHVALTVIKPGEVVEINT